MGEDLNFECSLTGDFKAELEKLFSDNEEERTLYYQDENLGLIPVFNLKKHPDCPKELYDEIIQRLTKQQIIYDRPRD